MIQPTQQQLDEVFNALKKQNQERALTYGRNAGKGPFLIIAKESEMTPQQVRNILKGRIGSWKRRHLQVYNLALKYAKMC